MLSKSGVEFEVVDINSSIKSLREFLALRDTRPEFEDIKKNGRVGLPCIVVNDGEEIMFSVGDDDLTYLLEDEDDCG